MHKNTVFFVIIFFSGCEVSEDRKLPPLPTYQCIDVLDEGVKDDDTYDDVEVKTFEVSKEDVKIINLSCKKSDCTTNCCKEDEKCSLDGLTCESKCALPKPLICKDTCCDENYECSCKNDGGFCLPGGAEMCDCKTKQFCASGQTCIKDKSCIAKGKFCKPWGAGGVENKDCPGALDCYCNPGSVCTYSEPACCPLSKPIPCGKYCCPEGSVCLKELNNCLLPGEQYCGETNSGCKKICPIGEKCMDKKCDCVKDDVVECDDGTLCSVALPICVGKGKGINKSGCCPATESVGCDKKCCPAGTKCDSGCGGCVENGYKCCPNDNTKCLMDKFCSKTGQQCLDSKLQDCETYNCEVGEVCVASPKKCCPAVTPNACGNICCKSNEKCFDTGSGGFCVNESIGETYCGNKFKCSAGLKCMTGFSKCIPQNSDQCFCKGKPMDKSCGPTLKCCGQNDMFVKEGKKTKIVECPSTCIPDGYGCFSNTNTSYLFSWFGPCGCPAGTKACRASGWAKNPYDFYCIPKNDACCGDAYEMNALTCPAGKFCKLQCFGGCKMKCCNNKTDTYGTYGCTTAIDLKKNSKCVK